MGLSNYPPGVTGNEPQITGEWPCLECGGEGGEPDGEGGYDRCHRCQGTGLEPEEFALDYLQDLVDTNSALCKDTLYWFDYIVLDRHKPEDRPFLKVWAQMRRLVR